MLCHPSLWPQPCYPPQLGVPIHRLPSVRFPAHAQKDITTTNVLRGYPHQQRARKRVVSITTTLLIFAFCFTFVDASVESGLVDVTFINVAFAGEPQVNNGITQPGIEIQHPTSTAGCHEPQNYKQHQKRKILNTY